jgi:hypothetical protein
MEDIVNSNTPLLAEATPTSINPDDADSVVQSIVTATNDSRKVRYLGYRASGFTIKESLSLIGVGKYPYKTLDRWRASDPEFVRQENNMDELRKTLGVEFAHIEFMRNYRLILQKDYVVITKSLDDTKELTTFEGQYLMKARGHYTPQQLEIMQKLIGAAKDEGQAFDFEHFVLTMSRKKAMTTETVTIEGSK